MLFFTLIINAVLTFALPNYICQSDITTKTFKLEIERLDDNLCDHNSNVDNNNFISNVLNETTTENKKIIHYYFTSDLYNTSIVYTINVNNVDGNTKKKIEHDNMDNYFVYGLLNNDNNNNIDKEFDIVIRYGGGGCGGGRSSGGRSSIRGRGGRTYRTSNGASYGSRYTGHNYVLLFLLIKVRSDNFGYRGNEETYVAVHMNVDKYDFSPYVKKGKAEIEIKDEEFKLITEITGKNDDNYKSILSFGSNGFIKHEFTNNSYRLSMYSVIGIMILFLID